MQRKRGGRRRKILPGSEPAAYPSAVKRREGKGKKNG